MPTPTHSSQPHPCLTFLCLRDYTRQLNRTYLLIGVEINTSSSSLRLPWVGYYWCQLLLIGPLLSLLHSLYICPILVKTWFVMNEDVVRRGYLKITASKGLVSERERERK